MRVQACGCLYPLTAQRTILGAPRWLLRWLLEDETYDVPKRVDLLMSNVRVVVSVMLVA
jgi:hypothetical protein